jgi:hypothetical protein
MRGRKEERRVEHEHTVFVLSNSNSYVIGEEIGKSRASKQQSDKYAEVSENWFRIDSTSDWLICRIDESTIFAMHEIQEQREVLTSKRF